MADIIEIVDPTVEPVIVVENINPIEISLATGIQGEQGIPGPGNSLTIGTVSTVVAGSSATANITGTSPNQVLNLTIPRGNTGLTGPPNNLTIGTVATLAAGASATASITGTSPNQTLNLGLPRAIGAVDTVNGVAPGSNGDVKVTRLQPSTSTNNTTDDNIGDWYKIGTISLLSQFSDINGTILLQTSDHGSSDLMRALIGIRAKQQEPYGNLPYLFLTVSGLSSDTDSFDLSYIAFVVVSTDGPTIVEMWVRNVVSYSRIHITEIAISKNNSSIVYSEPNQPGLNELPTGLVQKFGSWAPVEDLIFSATPEPNPDKIVRRDVNGYAHVVGMEVSLAPTAPNNVTRKDYVDNIGTSNPLEANSIARRDSGARFGAARLFAEQGGPTAPHELTRKDYVDSQISTRVPAFVDPDADRLLGWDDSTNAWVPVALDNAGFTWGASNTIFMNVASETVSGRVEMATAAETATGTDTTRAVHPAGLKPLLDAKASSIHTHTATDISNSTPVGRSVLLAADAATARSAIGAGTSNLAIGTTATTAKAGNYAPPVASTTSVGTIQLAGDLGGTPTAPTVPALAYTTRDLGAGSVLPSTGLRRGDHYNLNGALMVYDGSAWLNVNPNIGGDARYVVTALSTLNIAAGGNGLRVPLKTSEYTTADVTPNANSDLFTLNRAGLWEITANARFGIPAGGVGIFYISDDIGAGGNANTFASSTQNPVNAITCDFNLSLTKRFAVGQTLAIWAFCSAAAIIDTGAGRHVRTSISLKWVRP